MMRKNVFYLFSLLVMLVSCDSKTVLKDNYDIPDAQWYIKDVPTFTFEINDTTVAYNVFYNVRNNRAYPYYNLYLTHYLYDSTGKAIHQKLDELNLFDPVTGKKLGEGIGDVYDHKILAFKDFKFKKTGKYRIQVKQYMRQDPLQDLVSVGFTIEKGTK